jgi:hypothetical protein
MIYAGGGCSKVGVVQLRELGWGQIQSEGPWKKLDTPQWFFDNGAWEAFVQGKPFPEKTFLRRIDRCVLRGFVPDFIVLPDSVGDFPATLSLAAAFTDRVPVGWPRYLALQNGAIRTCVEKFMTAHRIHGLFLGGDDHFKNQTAAPWCDFAHDHGIKFHYARAGTPRKFAHAMTIGADSLDSSRLSRSWRDFHACKTMWLRGLQPRLIPEPERSLSC